MKIFKIILRSLSVLIMAGAIVFYILGIMDMMATGTMNVLTIKYLIIHAVVFVASLPGFIPMIIATGRMTGKVSLAIALLGIGMLLSPLMIAITVITSLVGLIRAIADAAYVEPSDMKDEICRYSMHRAAERLLDDNFDEDITIDDGESIRRYRQVALIEDAGEKYALLCPIDTGENVAYAYLIDTDDDGFYTLTHIVDKTLYSRIYRQYKRLLRA